jgi:hypothetical protein
MQDAAQTQSGSIDKPWIRDLDIALRNEDHKAAYEALTKYATRLVYHQYRELRQSSDPENHVAELVAAGYAYWPRVCDGGGNALWVLRKMNNVARRLAEAERRENNARGGHMQDEAIDPMSRVEEREDARRKVETLLSAEWLTDAERKLLVVLRAHAGDRLAAAAEMRMTAEAFRKTLQRIREKTTKNAPELASA